MQKAMRVCGAHPIFMKIAPFLAAAALAAENPASGNYHLPLDRPFTLRNAEPGILEAEFHRQTAGDRTLARLYPRPCVSEIDSAYLCREGGRLVFRDSARARALYFSPLAGLEYRATGDDNAGALDFGVLATGSSGALSFYLDARMFTETHEDANHPSFDGEFVERQGAQTSGSPAYSSYSRFRSNLSYDFGWGRLGAARDAAHWGPGLFTNLAFHRDAVPFNQLTFTAHLGPLTVQSLYGQLAPDTNWAFDTTADFRSVYAHRYEWRASRNLLLGLSEQLFLYKKEAPFAFVPLVPLYIAKAGEKERLNNGNLAGDITWRLPGLLSLYLEWLIDDIQSPASIFDDDWGNKWGLMAGMHWIRDVLGHKAGLIAEYARVEPWVYTHYVPSSAQAANLDYPLGNPFGPNSQAAIAKAYWREDGRWQLSLRSDMLWKGTDSGSAVTDIHAGSGGKKEFLKGVGSPEIRVKPAAWLGWKGLGVYAEGDLGRGPKFIGGVQARY